MIKVNGSTITDYVEPDNVEREETMAERVLNNCTIALQAHDPITKFWFKELFIRALP